MSNVRPKAHATPSPLHPSVVDDKSGDRSGPSPLRSRRPVVHAERVQAGRLRTDLASSTTADPIASDVRDRKAELAPAADRAASRKRKREESHSSSSSSNESEDDSARHDVKRTRHTMREGARLHTTAAADAEGPPEPTVPATQSVVTPGPGPSSPIESGSSDAVSTHSAPSQSVDTSDTVTAQTQEPDDSDVDSTGTYPPMHGEYVSVYSGARPVAASGVDQAESETGLGDLLFEEAVFTEHNEIIAISTDADRGVLAEGIEGHLVVIFSNPAGVGLMVVRPEHTLTLDDDFDAARAEFVDRTESDQDIRIRMAYNPLACRRQLEQYAAAAPVVLLRALLPVPPHTPDALVRQAAVDHVLARRIASWETLAASWGVLDPLISLPHGALHVRRDAIDLFDAPPRITLPANLDELPPSAQD